MGGEEFGERIREESCTSQDRTGYAAVTNIPQCLLSSYDKFVSCLKCYTKNGSLNNFLLILISTLTSENSVFSKMKLRPEIQEFSIQTNLNVIFLYHFFS